MTDRITTLEELSFRAWPAASVSDVDGWRLRHMSGVTRRANSAWVSACRGAIPVEARIEQVARFYAERGLPARMQISPACAPCNLDELLAERGWSIETPVAIQTAPVDQVERLSGPGDERRPPGLHATAHDAITDDWLEVSVRRGRFRDTAAIFRGLLDRLGDRAGYAACRVDGEPAAAGLGVCDGQWAGLFAMHTVEPMRRRGAGRAVLHTLARWARDRGVHNLYLQVERDNLPALALYRQAGFTDAYGYHYRIRKT